MELSLPVFAESPVVSNENVLLWVNRESCERQTEDLRADADWLARVQGGDEAAALVDDRPAQGGELIEERLFDVEVFGHATQLGAIL